MKRFLFFIALFLLGFQANAQKAKIVPPTAYLAFKDNNGVERRYRGGAPIGRAFLLENEGLEVEILGVNAKPSMKILSFEIQVPRQGSEIFLSQGNKFTEEQKNRMRKLPSGREFYITKIFAISADALLRELPPMEIIVGSSLETIPRDTEVDFQPPPTAYIVTTDSNGVVREYRGNSIRIAKSDCKQIESAELKFDDENIILSFFETAFSQPMGHQWIPSHSNKFTEEQIKVMQGTGMNPGFAIINIKTNTGIELKPIEVIRY
ncbi:MAG: hypothetical protein LBR81_06300 [Prevotellaceae bacterium]|jgi:hypothetical protein|nr:hypothetical protein [Prevotellaceae bacterium]